MNENWVIVTRQAFCPWCEKAKTLLTERGKTFTEFDNMSGFLLASGLTTVPQVFMNGYLIGGYDELRRYFEDLEGLEE